MTPFLRWAGGKRWFVPAWRKIIHEIDYDRYIEPFLGGGAIYFSTKPEKSILADSNNELISTYKAIKEDWGKVLRILRSHDRHHTREYYYNIRSAVYCDPAERAAQFIYLNRTCWNGLYRVNKAGVFNVPVGSECKRVLHEYDDFYSVAQCLKTADILCQDFEQTISQAESGDLLFVDPPYTVKHNFNGFVKYNENIFSWDDQERLCESLHHAKERGAKIVLMNANHQSIYSLYSNSFELADVSRASRIASDSSFRGKYSELVILGL